MSEEIRDGSCLCGAVRYRTAWPPKALMACHCRNCQKQSGSALSVIAIVARDDLTLTGNMAMFEDTSETGGAVYRYFCASCGSPLVTETPAARDDGISFIKAGTLDKTDDLDPSVHIWTRRAQKWLPFPEGVLCLQEQ